MDAIAKDKKWYLKPGYTNTLLQIGVIAFIVFLNILLSFVVRYYKLSFVPNYHPLGFSFGYYSSALIIFLVTVIVFQFNLIKIAPINSMLILSGIYSNFLEMVLYNNVADFITVFNISMNIADIILFFGLILLNYKIFFEFGNKNKLV